MTVSLYELIQNNINIFMLIAIRVSGIFIISPFLGSNNIPISVRAAASIVISMAIFPMLSAGVILEPPSSLPFFVMALGSELFIGWLIGFVAYLVLTAVHMAGRILDTQVGFGVVSMLDPTSGQQVPIIGLFKYNLAMLVFLATNSHHILLSGLFESFQLVPMLGANINGNIVELIVDFTFAIFVTGLKISFPVLAGILLADVALGVLARTMPQMNIFVVGIPMKIAVGLFVLSFSLPFYILFLDVAFNEIYGNIYIVLRALQ